MNRMVKTIGEACYRALGYYPANIHGAKFRVDPYHIGFWRTAAQGRWEPHTYRILSTFLNAESVYCDLGAWIGPTALYAATLCKQVICFEPDPVAYRYLRWNIELNKLDNITSFSAALSDRNGIHRMSNFGGSLGNTMTSLLDSGEEGPKVDVLTLTWDDFVKFSKIGKVDFIKIDIEGGEFALLPTMKDYLAMHKPIVYLSIHTGYIDNAMQSEKMGQVMDVMGIYRRRLDPGLRPVEPSDWGLDSYVFLD